MERTLDEINMRLKSIEERLTHIEKSSSKMGDHIDFVEETYVSLKAPLNYIKKKFSYITNG